MGQYIGNDPVGELGLQWITGHSESFTIALYTLRKRAP